MAAGLPSTYDAVKKRVDNTIEAFEERNARQAVLMAVQWKTSKVGSGRAPRGLSGTDVSLSMSRSLTLRNGGAFV